MFPSIGSDDFLADRLLKNARQVVFMLNYLLKQLRLAVLPQKTGQPPFSHG